jgi:hypothetical protein
MVIVKEREFQLSLRRVLIVVGRVLIVVDQEVNIHDLDAHMRKALDSIRFAIRHGALKPETKSFFADLLKVFDTSHLVIGEIVNLSIRYDRKPIVADALSLTREQVEKLYVAALFLDDQDKWFVRYMKNSWRKKYEEYLLELEENRENARLKEYLSVAFPRMLEHARRLHFPIGKQKIIVSAEAMKMVKYNFDFPHMPKTDKHTGKTNWPKYFSRKKLEEYFEFPTPGVVLRDHIHDPKTKELLTRWYKDYQYLCTYSHVGFGKLVAQGFSNIKSKRGGEGAEAYSEQESGYATFVSLTAIACVCTMILPFLKEDYGAIGHLKDFWNYISNKSLLSKTYWNLYARDVLN